MKKLILLAVVLVCMAFTTDEPKKLKVELTEQEWGAVMQVIDQSNAPHAQVKAVQEILTKQLVPQLEKK